MDTRSTRTTSQLPRRKKQGSPLSPVPLLTGLFTAFMDVLINIPVMNAVWRERRELELLSDEHIKDIGLNPGSVRWECKRGFLDIPANRKLSWREEGVALYRMMF